MFKKSLVLMVSLFFLLSVPWMSFGEKLTILHVNDTHSHLYPFGPHNDYGGIARMSTLIKKLKRKGGNVLTFHSGDVFVGTFAFNKYLGYPELKMMEGMYDAMSLGNHEFDLGIDTLAYNLGGYLAGGTPVTLPMLCANLDWKILLDYYPAEGYLLKNFVQPYKIMDAGNLTVGLVGVVTTDPNNYSNEVNAVLTDPIDAARDVADYLRNQGCDIVICFSHLGKKLDVMELSQVEDIDIIVGGHSHDAIFKPIIENGKIIVQAGEFGKYLGELKVDVNGGQVSLVKYKLHPIKKKIKKDPTLFQELVHLRMGILTDPRFGPVYSKKIAKAKKNLEEHWEEGNPHRDTPLGNLITDAIKTGVENNGYPVDFALEANGFIGHRIYKGKVVGNDILRSVPYGYDPVSGLGFKIKVVQLAGVQILAGLEFSVSDIDYTDDFSDANSMQVSGLTFKYDSGNDPWSRIDPSSVMINGQPLILNDPPFYGSYWVALNEQLANFLESLGMKPSLEIDTGLFEYNLVRDYMKKLKKLKYKSEGRIIDRALIK